VAGLATIGVPAPAAAAAVLLFRFLTWFLPIPVGAACWLLWRRGAGRHHVPAAPALSRAHP
jgi:putative heme transporter